MILLFIIIITLNKMKIFKDRLLLHKEISVHKDLAFVPTMGGLHAGHKYLIKKAKKKCKKTIVSIFVNPKQFNSKIDYNKYPRNLKKDLNTLNSLNIDYLYLPKFEDVYNFRTKQDIYLDSFSKKLCGKFRKQHFKGVVNVVNRFLETIEPKYILLGKKDYQQLFLIKKHIKKNKIKTTIIEVKTIRENNGIACSSRNFNLSKKSKDIASKIFRLLKNEKKKYFKNNLLKYNSNYLKRKIFNLGVKRIDYIEFLNTRTFKRPNKHYPKFNIFIAYYLDGIRLIDNI